MKRFFKKRVTPILAATIAAASLGLLTLQNAPAQGDGKNATPSAQDVMRDMDNLLKPSESTSSATRPASTQPAQTQPAKTSSPLPQNPDLKLITGVAPGIKPEAPKREDQFILNRVGRLVRVSDGKSLFVFDADQQTAQEQPMILLPCNKLELMENITRDRGDRVRFILSGQIFTYRDVNYLLPTIVRETNRRDNLNP